MSVEVYLLGLNCQRLRSFDFEVAAVNITMHESAALANPMQCMTRGGETIIRSVCSGMQSCTAC